MVGVVIVTHGQFGNHLLEAAQTILGPQEQCAHVAVEGTEDVDGILGQIKNAVKKMDTGQGVIILTDMFGGTPSNISLSLLQAGKVEVLTGANLPMLLRILSMREQELSQLALEAKNAGIQGIVVAGEVLSRKVES
jgi:PTS system mannose-specific IIA component